MMKDHRVDDGLTLHHDYDFHDDAQKQMRGEEDNMEEDDDGFVPGVSKYCNVTSGSVTFQFFQ